MLDLLLGKNFPGAKCKTLLKLSLARIKLLKNRREMQLKQMQKEVAQFLQAGQEATARIRVEHIIREQNILAAYEILELFCELLAARLPIIESQRECPLDLREAIASLIFAAPRCSDLPELLHIRNLFGAKYGKEFIVAATELRPDCAVNRQVIEKLSVRAPAAEIKLKTLIDIAAEHDVEWDSSATASEFFKLHEDLLYGIGANHISNGVKVPIKPKEENESCPTPDLLTDKGPTSGVASDILDLPTVPNRAVPQRIEPQLGIGRDSQSAVVTSDPVKQISSEVIYSIGQPESLQVRSTSSHPPVVNKSTPASSSCDSTGMYREKQFVGFVSPSSSNIAAGDKKLTSTHSVSNSKAEVIADLQDILAVAKTAVAAADRAAAAARAAADLAKVRYFDLSTKSIHGIREGVNESSSFGREE
ncbi:hypothetical protein SUGI_0104030 [Cryptomeria japonica]|nr:hypothetical protein SUGI_0104030 [Cryptomeria japonica]